MPEKTFAQALNEHIADEFAAHQAYLAAARADLAAMRALLRRTQEVRRFEPRDDLDWASAEARLTAARQA